MKGERNVWKIAFLSLVSSLTILFIALLGIFFISFPKIDHVKIDQQNTNGETMFVITTTKDRLNYFIAEQLSRDGESNFQIFLSDYVMLEAVIPLFSRNVAFQLDLEPELHGDGDLILKSHSFRLGEFELPSETLFRIIQNTMMFPEWIEINAKEEMIVLNMTDIKTLETLFIKVTQFDLERDLIEFELVSRVK